MRILTLLKERLAHYTWDIAYGEYSDSILKDGLKGIKLHIIKNPYRNKWFADPFILKETKSELHLLVEEFDSNIKRGRIARLVVDKQKDIITDCSIILDIPTHLSFPAIYREGDVLYVHPENSQSGKSYMYRYDENNVKLVDPVCVCNEPIADAVIVNKGSLYEMYATKDPHPNGNTLTIYTSKSICGPYTQVSQTEYMGNIARMAGAMFETIRGLIRPAQDCNGAYGKAVLLMANNNIIAELKPTSRKYAGVHTFNTSLNTFVIDLKRYDFPLLYTLKNKLK